MPERHKMTSPHRHTACGKSRNHETPKEPEGLTSHWREAVGVPDQAIFATLDCA